MGHDSSSPDFEPGGRYPEAGKSPVSPEISTRVLVQPPPIVESENPAKSPKKKPGIFRALHHRNFRIFWTGAFISNIGNWMQTVGQNWLVLSLTHSPFLLGLVSFIGNAPLLILGLVGGVVADRKSRKTVLLVTQSSMLALIMALAIFTFTGAINIWLVIVIVLGIGVIQAFNSPAYQTIMLDLVGKDDLMNAIALNSIQFNLTRVIGPSIAGILVVLVGVAACFFLNSLSFLAVIGALLLVKLPPVAIKTNKSSVLTEIKEGLGYLRRERALAALVILSGMVSILLFPYITLLSVFARDVYHGEATDYGLLLASVGAGAALGAVFLAAKSDIQNRFTLLIGGASLVAVTMLFFALSPTILLALFILPIVGGSMVVMNATMNTIVQSSVPDNLRGRVISIYTLSNMGLLPIGNLQAGTVAQYFGAPVAVGGGAIIFGLVILATFAIVPELKKV